MASPTPSSSISSSIIKPIASNTIRTVTMKEKKAVARTLLEAFKDDHVMRYFIDTPDAVDVPEDRKLRRLRKLLELTTSFHIAAGVVTTVGPDYDSVALWLPPADPDFGFTFIKHFWRLKYILSPEGRTRFFADFCPLLERTKTDVLGSKEVESWYLVYLATKPGSQGRGYGRMLVEQMVEDSDKLGRSIYLESSNEANLRFYGKMGFSCVKQIQLTRDVEEIGLDILVREPKQD